MRANRNQFDQDWKTKPFKDRGFKFFLKPDDETNKILDEYRLVTTRAINCLSQHIHAQLSNETLSIGDIESKNSAIATKIWHSYDEHLTNIIGLHKARQKRGATFIALRLYRGYLNRNKKIPKTPPRSRSKNAIYQEDGVIGHVIGTASTGFLDITVHGLENEKPRVVRVPYELPKGMLYKKPFLKEPLSGNLIKQGDKWFFVARTRITFDWVYQPTKSIGFDLNKDPNWFITLSEAIDYCGKQVDRLKHSKVVSRLSKRLVVLNKALKTEKLKSCQRRAIRAKVQSAHRKLKKACMIYIDPIINHVTSNNLLLCLDPLSCGARHGSFGQDKVLETLKKVCEDRRIPFVRVPTPHTSKCCHNCWHECDRPNNDTCVCANCGSIPAHRNGAWNVAKWGVYIWHNGLKQFVEWKKEHFIRKNSLPTVGV